MLDFYFFESYNLLINHKKCGGNVMVSIGKRPAWAEINLDNLEFNFRELKKRVTDSTKMCMVVKADAYGHGAVEIARFYESIGADFFAVSRAKEARELREYGIKLPILNLGVTFEDEYDFMVEEDLSMTIFDYGVACDLNDIAKRKSKKARVHIKLDTGMSRLGYIVEDNIDYVVGEIKKISSLENIFIEGMFTHFANADEANQDFKNLQFSRFKSVVDRLKDENIDIRIIHCSNSAAILNDDDDFNMVRPGVIQYGVYPSDEVGKNVKIKPVMSFKCRVANIKDMKPGVSIGYGRNYTTCQNERIATITVGYADGFLRGRKNPYVYIKGTKCPIVGNICMDQTMVRLPDGLDVQIGDEVLLFGEEFVGVEQVAKDCSTIVHEVWCNINKRVDRVYKKNGEFIKLVDYLEK